MYLPFVVVYSLSLLPQVDAEEKGSPLGMFQHFCWDDPMRTSFPRRKKALSCLTMVLVGIEIMWNTISLQNFLAVVHLMF